MQKEEEIISNAYIAFNCRDIDKVLLLLDPNVEWPNGWEGGYLFGHDSVREYWTRQWKEVDPHVAPENISRRPDRRMEVLVKQTVRDISGNILNEGFVKHVYSLRKGLIIRMEIKDAIS